MKGSIGLLEIQLDFSLGNEVKRLLFIVSFLENDFFWGGDLLMEDKGDMIEESFREGFSEYLVLRYDSPVDFNSELLLKCST